MKVYSYCAYGNNNTNLICVFSGIGAFASEEIARNYITDNFYTMNGTYPQRVQISLVHRSQLQAMLNDSEE